MKQEWNKKRVVPPGIEIPGIPTQKKTVKYISIFSGIEAAVTTD